MGPHPLPCGYEVTVTRLVRLTAKVPVVATSPQEATDKAEAMVRDGEVTAWTEQMTERCEFDVVLKLDTSDGARISAALGPDLQTCHLILEQMAAGKSSAHILAKLKMDPLEFARVMSKMRHLGLVG